MLPRSAYALCCSEKRSVFPIITVPSSHNCPDIFQQIRLIIDVEKLSMRLDKKQSDALNSAIGPDDAGKLREAIKHDGVLAWSVFDGDGGELANKDVPEKVGSVCASILDMAARVGTDLGEETEALSLTFIKGKREMQTIPLDESNLLVVRDKTAGFRKELRNGD